MKDIDLIYKLNKEWSPQKIKIKKAGGQTNRNYIVSRKSGKFFVRLPWESDVIDRKIEGKNILALLKNKKLSGILPKYYVYVFAGKNILSQKREKIDLPDGAMATEYIDGKEFTIGLFKNKKYQEKIARIFYTLHNSGVRFVNKYNVFRDEIEKYRIASKKYPVSELIDEKIAANLEKIEKEILETTPLLKKSVPAHNDFIFQNLLVGDNGKVYILDFEYAGMNERGGIFYDFAFLFTDNFFRKEKIEKALFEKFLKIADKVYGENLDRRQIYRLTLAVTVMQVWWGILRYFSVKTGKEKRYFKDYILRRIGGIDLVRKLTEK